MDIKELYKEIILDHGKNPRNFGRCRGFNADASGHNPLCGDKVHIYAKLNDDKRILDLSFEGEGCAISLASASILTDIIKGKEYNVSAKIINDFLRMIKVKEKISLNSLNDDQITTMMSLSGVKEFPMRVKCATMAWHTLSDALNYKK
tara:strand:+ start:162 stop:605 length:444 start_codon:yes stop_codon:yes gene_type:complete